MLTRLIGKRPGDQASHPPDTLLACTILIEQWPEDQVSRPTDTHRWCTIPFEQRSGNQVSQTTDIHCLLKKGQGARLVIDLLLILIECILCLLHKAREPG